MKKKSVILYSLAAICVIGLITSYYIDWPVDIKATDGDISKAAKFSREQMSDNLTNMEELLQTDSAFKDGIVAAQVVMQTRAVQFGTLVDLSNEAAGNIPAFAEVLKDMNANRELVDNVAISLAESAEKLNAALGGEECPDLAQSTINASLAYTTLQKQNNLANRFIETTDKYLETAQGDDKLKLVRDQWLEYQQMTAALDGDKAYAEALAKKGNLLSGEQALAAVANFDIAERLVVLQSCELAQAMKLPNQIVAMPSRNFFPLNHARLMPIMLRMMFFPLNHARLMPIMLRMMFFPLNHARLMPIMLRMMFFPLNHARLMPIMH